MGRPKKITPDLEDEAIALAAQGWSAARIAERFRKSRGVDVTRQAITKVLAQRRRETSEATKAVVRDRTARSAVGAIDVVERRLRGMARLTKRTERKALEDPKWLEWHVKALGRLESMTALVLKHSGADEPDVTIGGLADLVGLAFDRKGE